MPFGRTIRLQTAAVLVNLGGRTGQKNPDDAALIPYEPRKTEFFSKARGKRPKAHALNDSEYGQGEIHANSTPVISITVEALDGCPSVPQEGH